MKPLLLALALLLIAGCGPSQADYDAALAQIESLQGSIGECEASIAELEDLPANRLAHARALEQEGSSTEAEAIFAALIDRYPDSEEAQAARDAITGFEKQREAARLEEERKRQEEERRKRLGFKVLRAQSSVETGSVTMRVVSVQIGRRWVFDRYGDRYYYRDAVRGEKHIVADVRFTSEAHNPRLPAISAYRVIEGKLHHIGRLQYEFHRWRDYGAYLGNYGDNRNDFAHTETIRFSAGLSVRDAVASEPLFILVDTVPCFRRTYDRLSNPPTSYSDEGCLVRSSLSLNEAEQSFQVIKVFNAGKL